MSFIIIKNIYIKPVTKNLGDTRNSIIFSFFVRGIDGALKAGPDAGLYEKESIDLLYYAFASVGTMLLGIVAGIIVKIFADE